jgi:glutamate racemase
VVREIRRRLPRAGIVYVGDSIHAPYGPRSAGEIVAFTRGLAHFLLGAHGCAGLVIACNTATAAAAQPLRAELPGIPIVGMEPAVKPAIAATRTGKVGVLATVGTLASARFAALLGRWNENGAVAFYTQSCDGWVEAVERGDLEGPETRALVARYVLPLVARGVDTLVLGCTHYPVLRALIAEAAGPGVTLIDTGEAVARRAAVLMPRSAESAAPGELRLFTTGGDPCAFRRAASAILGQPVTVTPCFWKNGELIEDAPS